MSIPEGAMFVVSGWGATTESGSISFALLAPLLLLFVWDQANMIPVELSTMLPRLFFTLTLITLNLVMMLVSLNWKRLPLTACQLNNIIIRKGLFSTNYFLQMSNFCFRASPVSLPSSAMSIPEGAMFVVSGWGTTSESGPLSDTLRYNVHVFDSSFVWHRS